MGNSAWGIKGFLAAASVLLVASPAWSAPTPSPSETALPTPSASALASVNPSPVASPSTSPSAKPNPIGSCSAKAALSQKELGHFYGYVIDVATGKVLLDVRGQEATPSASVLKVLTVAAALVNLPATYRATTKVYTLPDQPGTIVLQGGGDHTLSRMTGESYTTYAKPARLETLASQVLAGWKSEVPISKIILDSSFFAGPSYSSAWKLSDRTNGYISHITALQVDSDRANPDLTSRAYNGYRSTDPVMQTGQSFKLALQGLAEDAQLVKAATPKNAVLLTKVSSQTISTWLSHAISVSDNTETEFIARHAAKAAGLSPAFSSIQPLVTKSMAAIGVDAKGLKMLDGSGLAQGNRVTAKMISELMLKVASASTGPNPALAELETYLPIAGRTGTLAGRFNGKNATARTFVRGKSGYIPGLYSLAGIVNAKDGTRLAYAIFARSAEGKSVTYTARPALDTLATRFYECGFGLTK